jgi:hypothetical protein
MVSIGDSWRATSSKRSPSVLLEQSSGLAAAHLDVHVGLHENCEMPLLEETFTVPLSNKIHVVVLSTSHSKIYIYGSVEFFCEDPVFL